MPEQTASSPSGETLGVQEAADFLRLGYESMKTLIDSGAVPALVLNQRHAVLLREELIAYVREEGRKQADERKRKQSTTVVSTVPVNRRGRRGRVLPDLDALERSIGIAPQSPSQALDRMMRLPEVTRTLGVGTTFVYELIKTGRFPKPVKLGRASVWPESVVAAFVGSQKEFVAPE